MDSQAYIPDVELEKSCECGRSYCSNGVENLQHWNRAVKRKVDGFEDENGVVLSGLDYPVTSNARVEIENECDALREIVNNQQQSIQDMYMELEEERNSSSTAANETMSMILRLQRDKSEIQMEARQFKNYAEERMAHDQQEITALEDLLYKREQVIQSLTCEVQAYKLRMMSYGLKESEVEGEIDDECLSQGGNFDFFKQDYPPLRCDNEINRFWEVDNDDTEADKYLFGGTPHSTQHIMNLKLRISQMERSPSLCEVDVESPATKRTVEKVVVGQSHMMHTRKFSVDSSKSFLGYGQDYFSKFPTESPKCGNSFKKMDYVVYPNDHSNARRTNNLSEVEDFMRDRLYTMDSVNDGEPCSTPREFANLDEFEDPEINKLYMRVQALEAERESMRQTLISMSTDKAQFVLLKEIAQQLCNDVTPERHMPARKPSIFGIFPFVTVFQWVASIVFWRKDANPSKYMFGLNANMGLLMLLHRGPHAKQWRCLTRPLM